MSDLKYTGDPSHDMMKRIAALTAEVERLKGELDRVRDLAEHDRAAFSDTACVYRTALRETREAQDKLRTALRETREALEFVIGDHNIPGDCYSTGPVTGTPLDAVCPSCSGIRVLARHAALAGEEKSNG